VERSGLQAMALAQRSIGLTSFLRSHPVERVIRGLLPTSASRRPTGP